jgi:uncharacterized protein YegP (UPF0339 family)
MAKFRVYTDSKDRFRWKFIATNKKVVAKSSRSFAKREECVQSVSLLQKEISGAPVKHRVGKAPPKKTPALSAAPRAPLAPRQASPTNAPPRTPPIGR